MSTQLINQALDKGAKFYASISGGKDGAVTDVTGLEPEDQAYFDASANEPDDGAYSD